MSILSKNLEKVKGAISNKRPFEFDVERKIRELNNELKSLDNELSRTAYVDYTMIPTAQKLVSLGEIKAEFKSIDFSYEYKKDYDKEIENKNTELNDLESQYIQIEERRELVIETLNEYIQMYVEISKDALDEYGNYCARFDYKNKRLTLKKNKSASIAQISSSSDHLFMHLCMFAGIHHLILNEAVNYVPSYLIIDQPSRPYFNNSEYDYKDSKQSLSKKDDWSKVKNIFTLWDNFFVSILEQKKHFQLIILEHVSEEAWRECEHVHLVEIFDGEENALIPLKLRLMHLALSYWVFVLASFHLGIYWNRIPVARKVTADKKISALLRLTFLLYAAYGVHVFIKRQFALSMFLQVQFAFLDYGEPVVLFFMEYFAVMCLSAVIGYYMSALLHRLNRSRGHSPGRVKKYIFEKEEL